MSTADWKKIARISLNGASQGHVYKESFAAALALSKNGRRLYVVDQANCRVVVIDTATRTRMASLKTGVNPIALCLSPDDKRLYVANSGLFEYKTIPGADNADRLHSGLHFPPFGYPSPPRRTELPSKGGRLRAWAMPTMCGAVRCGPTTLSGPASPACSLAAVGDVDCAREPCGRRRRTFRGGGQRAVRSTLPWRTKTPWLSSAPMGAACRCKFHSAHLPDLNSRIVKALRCAASCQVDSRSPPAVFT